MENCKECGSSHDPANIDIPKPIPDGVCAFCGTQLTDEKMQALVSDYEAKKAESELLATE